MKKISRWAQRHPILTRLIIIIIHLLIIANGLFYGLLLFFNDWQHANDTVYLLVFSFVLLYIFYPKRGQKTGPFKYSYRAQKIHDFGLVLLSFLMISVATNSWLAKNIGTKMTASPTATFIVHKHKKPSKRQFKKQIRKELRTLKKAFKKRKNKEKSGFFRMLLNIFVFGAAIALGFLLAAYSCSLHCSGSPGLAIVVGIVGYLLLITLVALFIHKTMSKKSRSKAEKTKRKKHRSIHFKEQKL